MTAKKELLATALLAIALAVGLGTLSFGLFSGTPPDVQIHVSAEKNGATSLLFLPQDQVLLEANVTSNGASVAGASVTFEVQSPNGTNFLNLKADTDSLGTANVTFQIPWPSIITSEDTWELGMWQAQAEVEINGQKVFDKTNFNCTTVTPWIEAYTNKGGRGLNAFGGTFYTNETVLVYIEVYDELDQPVPYEPVSFEVLIVGGGHYATEGGTTNSSGIATIINPINPTFAAKYEDIATASYAGINMTDVVTINVQLGS